MTYCLTKVEPLKKKPYREKNRQIHDPDKGEMFTG